VFFVVEAQDYWISNVGPAKSILTLSRVSCVRQYGIRRIADDFTEGLPDTEGQNRDAALYQRSGENGEQGCRYSDYTS
jgi:hypothetical protein